jgi:hypothetical protein
MINKLASVAFVTGFIPRQVNAFLFRKMAFVKFSPGKTSWSQISYICSLEFVNIFLKLSVDEFDNKTVDDI